MPSGADEHGAACSSGQQQQHAAAGGAPAPDASWHHLAFQQQAPHGVTLWPALLKGMAPIFASLSTSLQQLGKRRPGTAHPRPVPKLVETLMGLPVEYLEAQATAEQIYQFYQAQNGFFPRPCPECSSSEFLVPCSHLPGRPGKGPKGPSRSGGPGADGKGGAGALVLGSGSGGSGGTGVLFGSRPLVCEQCQRWFHLGCMGVGHVEDIPTRPWFHCRQCRDMYIKMEALGHRGQMIMPIGPSGPVSYSIATPADFRLLLAGLSLEATAAGGGGHPGQSVIEGSRVVPVLELLGQAGLPEHAVAGVMNPWSEYDGGRYAIVLRQEGVPVSAATFNVFSTEVPAQVNLVATAGGQRRRGHCRALFEILESCLEDLKIGSVVLQPPPDLEHSWAKQLGFAPMHPAQVSALHMSMPLAYFDAPVLQKEV